MTRGCVVVLALVAMAAPLHAQRRVDVGLDVGVAMVHYDGFLPSGAAAVTPTLRVAGRRTALDARASSLFFQSGRSSVSADVDGSWRVAGTRVTALQLDVSGGGSQYASNYRYAYGLAGARLVVERPRGTTSAWIAGRGGAAQSSVPVDPLLGTGAVRTGVGAVEGSAGAVGTLREVVLRGELRGERVGRERIADAQLSGGWRRGAFGLDALVGARRARIDAVRGFAEGGLSVQVGDRVGLALHAGRYATDPLQGVVAGRFAELSARVALGGDSHSAADVRRQARTDRPFGEFTSLGFEVRAETPAGRDLYVRVPGAARVEIMADFTNWEPVALRAAGDGRWAFTARVPSGVHRVNVRIDGGTWTVPPGLTAVADEFGGTVGLLIVD